MTKAIAAEFHARGIRANAVARGGADGRHAARLPLSDRRGAADGEALSDIVVLLASAPGAGLNGALAFGDGSYVPI
ncbi:hypothetical protein [Janthinobacterium sp.]|uniref:hypothetical protein n=1 Tax=Janthinobacterium sp. TaxID=1871054 RepID=UPI00293D3AEC|nr:hypothetical protein [Janthinobacterium sp.]